MDAYSRYQTLIKPKWAPPAKVFGPVWSVLYLIIAVTYGYTFYQIYLGVLPSSLLWPMGLNLAFNLAYTPIQFRLKNNYLASVDVLLVLVTLAWTIGSLSLYLPWAALLNVPYFLWVCFASLLQLTITWLNWPAK